MDAATAGGASASTQVARTAIAWPKRSRVRWYSATSATRNIALETSRATQNGLRPTASAAHMTMGMSGKNATLVNTSPTWPTSKAYPRRAMSRYQVVSHEPSRLSARGTAWSRPISARPSVVLAITPRAVTNRRLASHATRGTPIHAHHGMEVRRLTHRGRPRPGPSVTDAGAGGGADCPFISG